MHSTFTKSPAPKSLTHCIGKCPTSQADFHLAHCWPMVRDAAALPEQQRYVSERSQRLECTAKASLNAVRFFARHRGACRECLTLANPVSDRAIANVTHPTVAKHRAGKVFRPGRRPSG